MAIPISNVTRRVVYSASGTGPYAFTFEILTNTDIAVFKDDTLLTLTTDYTVTIASNGTGSITLVAAPTGATQIAIVGNRTIQRTTDFVTGGDFFANTVNDEMDQQTIFAQQNAEGLQRALSAPQTDPTSINMTLPRAALRANKALGFDANGNPVIADTLGTNRGNWASGTLYYVRDIIKDTTNSNIWQVIVQHTSSGSLPIGTNADAAKFTLLVDAAAASTSATNAAASASAASTSASNASTSASNASSSASTASTQASNASTSASNAASSASAASSSASTASTQATNAGTSATAAAASASSASSSASAASTSASNASTSASNASTSASGASTSATNAANSATAASGSASTASTQATNAANSATAAAGSATSAASAQTAAESARDATLAAYDSFDDRYLGAKTSNPTVDNDGNALVAGALYFNSVSGAMQLWTGSAWVAAYVSGSGYLAAANNLSDVASTSSARTNLGLAIGTNVQAWDADLDTWAGKTAPSGTVVGTTDTQTLTNKTLTAPTIASANLTTALTVAGASGTSGQVLTSGGSGAAPTWSTPASPSTAGGATVTNPMSSNVTLTSSSNRVQVFTPSAQGYTVTLPDATTLSAAGGPIFELQNTVSEYPIAVMDSSGTNIGWIVSDYQSSVYLTSVSSATGNWVIKTGNPAADGGVYPYGASYGLTGAAQVSRSIGLGLGKNIAVGLTGSSSVAITNYTMVSSTRAINGGNQQSNNFSPAGFQYFMCGLSSTLFFVIYQDTTNSLVKCYATSVDSAGITTKGTELSLGSTNNAISPFCIALSSTSVLVYFNGPNASNFAIAQVVSISGTTCTSGAALGGTSNVVGASIGSTASIATLSSTKAHYSTASTVYSITISGTTLSRAGFASAGATVYGIVPVSATQSMVIRSNGAGGLVAAIATDASGTITFGTASASFAPIGGTPSVSYVATGVALVLCGKNGTTNDVGEIPFFLIKSVSGVPTLIGRGYLPATMQSQNFFGVLEGVSAMPIVATSNASNATSYQYKKIAITGAV